MTPDAAHPPTFVDASAHEPVVHPLRAVLRALRGRWTRTLALAAVLGGAGAAAGMKAAKPEYEATGMLRVSPTTPRVMRADDDGPLLPPFFDAFASTQASYLTSRPVLLRAATDPELAELDWPTGDDGADRVARSVKVDRPKGVELISVVGTGPSAPAAARVVNALLRAYDAVHGESAQRSVSQRERALVEREQSLAADLAENEKLVIETGGEYEAQTLSKAHLDKVSYLQELDRRIAELDDSIAQEVAKSADGDLKGADEEIMRLTVLDNAMAELLFEHARLSSALAGLRQKYPDDNAQVRATTRQIEVLDKALEDRRTQLALLGKNGVLAKRGDAGSAQSAAQLRALRESLVATHARVRLEAVELNRKSLRLSGLAADRTRLQSQREDAQRELERARTESRADLPGRVSVAVFAAPPSAPARDRSKALGALGGVGGGAFALAVAVLGGLLRRRLRWSDELDGLQGRAEVLGVLPWTVADRVASREAFEQAVRHAAQVLEVRSAGLARRGLVIAVTGAGRSGGKTTVATALASALARARLRTVLVDADAGARGATARLALLDRPGVTEFVGGAAEDDVIHPTAFAGLSAVPAGLAATGDAHLSRAPVTALLERLRDRFQAVVVDAGSVDLGLEGGLVASVADETLVVVGAGQPTPQVAGALRLLARYGQHRPVRLVFNGALRGDPGLHPAPAEAPLARPLTLALPETA